MLGRPGGQTQNCEADFPGNPGNQAAIITDLP